MFNIEKKELQNIFIQSSPRYKLYLFSILPNAHLFDIEYSQGILLPIFDVEDSSGLFVQLSIFLIKNLMSA